MFLQLLRCLGLLCAFNLAVCVSADEPTPMRVLLVKRLRRRLPGSKGSGRKSSSPKVNCVGSWGAYGTCGSNSKQTRTYTITKSAKNGGTACPYSHGAKQQRACVQNIDCVGAFGPYGSCSKDGDKTRIYEITTSQSGTGTSCPHVDGYEETATCTYVPPDVTVNWQYMASSADQYNITEMPMVHCSPNQVVEIAWSAENNIKHDVYQMADEDAYVQCSFAGADKKHSSVTSGSFSFTCGSEIGTSYFACSVNDACAVGKQKLRVHVTKPSNTASLRANNITTLAQYMEETVDVYYGGRELSESVASSLMSKLQGVIDNSPTSCSDWIPSQSLSNATCLAYAYTDMGYISRQRVTANYAVAYNYYSKALALIPNFCLPESYLVELFIKQGTKSKSEIDAQFNLACSACGNAHLDMEILRNEYDKRKWSYPLNSLCKREVLESPAPALLYEGMIPDSATMQISAWQKHSQCLISLFLSIYLFSSGQN